MQYKSYIKQLDSIRAISILLVIITHWLPENNRLNIYTSIFNGVDIFFVLSGFLITRILLENRNEAEKSGAGKLAVFKNFFIRRILRIFPIYYLTILFLFIAGDQTETGIRHNIFFFLTYTSNFYFFKIQGWDGILSHLWSLSVEEQFYLIWPWFMLLVNRKSLLPVILTSIFIGVVGQLYMSNVLLVDILTFACFDGFGFGALLAWVVVYKPDSLNKYYKIGAIIAIISLALQITRVSSQGNLVLLPSRTLTSLFTIWVIIHVMLYGEKKVMLLNPLLNNHQLIFIGKISYGVYLYHLILPHFTSEILTDLNSFLPPGVYKYNFYLVMIENFCLLILLSWLSWKIVEQPILKLKRHFEYQNLRTAKMQRAQYILLEKRNTTGND